MWADGVGSGRVWDDGAGAAASHAAISAPGDVDSCLGQKVCPDQGADFGGKFQESGILLILIMDMKIASVFWVRICGGEERG